MTESETKIRESLLDALSFLASVTEQLEFATKVSYAAYQDEFAHWWFDTFFPEDPKARNMFNPTQLEILMAFSKTFEQCDTLDGKHLTIQQLQATTEWQKVIVSAQVALSKLEIAA